jgi:hypothetical protein
MTGIQGWSEINKKIHNGKLGMVLLENIRLG